MAQGIVVVGSGVDPASYYNKTQVDDALAKKLDTAGGEVSGQIVTRNVPGFSDFAAISNSAEIDAGFMAQNTQTKMMVSFGVASNGALAGIYDHIGQQWIVDRPVGTKDVYFSGDNFFFNGERYPGFVAKPAPNNDLNQAMSPGMYNYGSDSSNVPDVEHPNGYVLVFANGGTVLQFALGIECVTSAYRAYYSGNWTDWKRLTDGNFPIHFKMEGLGETPKYLWGTREADGLMPKDSYVFSPLSLKVACAAAIGRGGDVDNPMYFKWEGLEGQPTWLWGSEDGTTTRVYNPKNFSVNYATSAGSAPASGGTATNAEYLSNDSTYMRFHWSGQDGQPTWLWGGNDASNMYLWNPSNFSVNYASSAGNGIIASGSGYVRFGDGTQICWGFGSAGTSTGNGAAAGYIAFPVPFSDTGYAFSASAYGTWDHNNTVGWIGTYDRTAASTFVNCANGAGGNFVWLAIGRWK